MIKLKLMIVYEVSFMMRKNLYVGPLPIDILDIVCIINKQSAKAGKIKSLLRAGRQNKKDDRTRQTKLKGGIKNGGKESKKEGCEEDCSKESREEETCQEKKVLARTAFPQGT